MSLPERYIFRCQSDTYFAARAIHMSLPERYIYRCQSDTYIAARAIHISLPERYIYRCQSDTYIAARAIHISLPERYIITRDIRNLLGKKGNYFFPNQLIKLLRALAFVENAKYRKLSCLVDQPSLESHSSHSRFRLESFLSHARVIIE